MKTTERAALRLLLSDSKEHVVADSLRLLKAFVELPAKARQELIEEVERRLRS
jgi:hypothetical protein